jgi:hypothetical protein
MRIERRYPAVDWAPSPDGRSAVVTTYSVDEPPERHVLLDLTTGTTRPLGSDLRVAGWLAPDLLVISVGDEVRVIDAAGQVRERWPAATDQVIVDDGTIIASRGRRLNVLRSGPGNTFRAAGSSARCGWSAPWAECHIVASRAVKGVWLQRFPHTDCNCSMSPSASTPRFCA